MQEQSELVVKSLDFLVAHASLIRMGRWVLVAGVIRWGVGQAVDLQVGTEIAMWGIFAA